MKRQRTGFTYDYRGRRKYEDTRRGRVREYKDRNTPGGARDQLIEAIDKLLGDAQTPLDDDAPKHALS
jgi:hypothetical protein